MKDVSPEMYEDVLRFVFKWNRESGLQVKPTCAPQFMRLAKELGVDASRWSRGCIAGISYCRIYPNGSVTPCPYLPIKVGNIRNNSFKEIWFGSEILNSLRDYEDNLQGRCGVCEYRTICGGCRARAFSLSETDVNLYSKLQDPNTLSGNLFAEDPWCKYIPKTYAQGDMKI